jgi:5-oxoprolinase (ATP-hydrolysing)/N-methylhydantoinase B
MSEEMRVSCFIEKEDIRPWGLFGGEPGRNSGIKVSQDGGETFKTMTEGFGVACNGKFSDVYLARGDSIRITTSGGGG